MSFAVSAAKLLTDVKISSGSSSSNLACKENLSHLQCNDILLDSSNNRGRHRMDPLNPSPPPSKQCLLHNVQRHNPADHCRAPRAGGAGNIPQQSLSPYGMLPRQHSSSSNNNNIGISLSMQRCTYLSHRMVDCSSCSSRHGSKCHFRRGLISSGS